MTLIALMTIALCVLLFASAFYCGKMRAKHNVPSPAMQGPDEFMRAMRAQLNLIESVVVFMPLVWMWAFFGNPLWAGIVAAVYFVARVWFQIAFAQAANKRGKPFMLSALCILIAAIGALASVVFA